MSLEALLHSWPAYAMNPLALAFGLFVLTFVLEDLALALGAWVYGMNLLPPATIAVVLFMGILLGDLWLYALGRYGKRWPALARLFARPGIKRVGNILHNNLWGAVFTARGVPGMRLPVYTGIGALGVPALKFIIMAMAAVMLWGGCFALALLVATHLGLMLDGVWHMVLPLLAISVFAILPRLIGRRLRPVMAA